MLIYVSGEESITFCRRLALHPELTRGNLCGRLRDYLGLLYCYRTRELMIPRAPAVPPTMNPFSIARFFFLPLCFLQHSVAFCFLIFRLSLNRYCLFFTILVRAKLWWMFSIRLVHIYRNIN